MDTEPLLPSWTCEYHLSLVVSQGSGLVSGLIPNELSLGCTVDLQ